MAIGLTNILSHGGQYLWPAAQFAMAGFAPSALDLRGRGKSDGDRFHAGHISEYVADVDAAFRLAKSRHPGLPVFLLGHSAGGVVSCSFALEHQAEIKGLSRLAPHLRVLRLKNEDFSRERLPAPGVPADHAARIHPPRHGGQGDDRRG